MGTRALFDGFQPGGGRCTEEGFCGWVASPVLKILRPCESASFPVEAFREASGLRVNSFNLPLEVLRELELTIVLLPEYRLGEFCLSKEVAIENS